jgi:hypothetical protein
MVSYMGRYCSWVSMFDKSLYKQFVITSCLHNIDPVRKFFTIAQDCTTAKRDFPLKSCLWNICYEVAKGLNFVRALPSNLSSLKKN